MSPNALRRGTGVRQEGKAPRRCRATRLRVESLEPREVPSAALALDFDTTTSPTARGFTSAKLALYSAANHFGWTSLSGMSAVNRSITNPLDRDFHCGTDGTFLADVPDGTYDVTVGLGDASVVRDRVSVWAQGRLLAADVTTRAGQFLEVRGRVAVTNGQFNLRLADGG